MTTYIEGTVEDANGNGIGGAVVYAINEGDDSIAGVTTTDSVGNFRIEGLSSFNTYHVGAQYDDGSTKYNGESKPLVEPWTDDGAIDDFEDSDVDEYTGDKISYQTQNNIVQEGTVALRMGNDDGAGHEIFSTSGLPRYPAQGDAFSFRVYFEGGDSTASMFFGVQDSDNYYRAKITPSVSEISIDKRVGGSLTNLDFAAASIPTGEWLEGVVEWSSDDAVKFILKDASGNELGSTNNVDDSEFSSGGIGWDGFVDAYSSNSVYYDIAQITTAGGIGSTIVIDDFEDGQIDEYVGDTGAVTVQTGTVNEGTYAAEIGSGKNEIRSTSGLDRYPQQGDVFRFNHNFPDGAIPRFAFGIQDADNYYRVEFDTPADTMRLIKRDAGSETTLDSTDMSSSFEFNAWTETEVEWRTNGRMLVEHFGSGGGTLGTLDATDTAYPSGGVGWGEWSGPIASQNLISWWKYNSGSGSTATDYEDSNDGTISGATWVTDSKTGGQALDFDGTDDVVTVTQASNIDLTTSLTFSVTAWVKLNSGGDGGAHVITSNFSFNTSNGQIVEFRDLDSDGTSELRFYVQSQSGVTDSVLYETSLFDDTWHHVAAVRRGSGESNLDIYVDGSPVSTTIELNDGAGTGSSDASHTFGARGGNWYLNGTLDDIRYYNTDLTDTQVNDIYNNTK